MAGRIPWIEKKFVFEFPADNFPEIIERLRGTPPRIVYRLRNIPADLLNMRHEGGWSIQEHAGHLLDLEPLFSGRLDDFDHGLEELRPADMTNRKTFDAVHNENTIGNILKALEAERAAIVKRLESCPAEAFARTALHPRLKTPMRMVDSLYFQAEHDDYHLARITDIARFYGY
jgi:uncharacterized damage-inducible protein DinB